MCTKNPKKSNISTFLVAYYLATLGVKFYFFNGPNRSNRFYKLNYRRLIGSNYQTHN